MTTALLVRPAVSRALLVDGFGGCVGAGAAHNLLTGCTADVLKGTGGGGTPNGQFHYHGQGLRFGPLLDGPVVWTWRQMADAFLSVATPGMGQALSIVARLHMAEYEDQCAHPQRWAPREHRPPRLRLPDQATRLAAGVVAWYAPLAVDRLCPPAGDDWTGRLF